MNTLYTALHAQPKKAKGFTLIELLAVVAMIGVLAAIALPSYKDYIIRANLPQATAALAACQASLEQRFQDTRSYGGACAATDDFSAPVITLGPNAGTPPYTTYSITISGKAGHQVENFSYTVDSSNTRSSDVSSGGPSGWSGNTGCWIRQKGGQC